MATLNLRGISDDVYRAVKARAAEQGVSIPKYCEVVLEAASVPGAMIHMPAPEITSARTAAEVVVDLPESVRRALGTASELEPAKRGEGVELCPYTEYDTDTGETYRCGRVPHGPKVKHTRGGKV